MNNNHFDIEVRRPSYAEIAARAYELYVQHGRREGRAHEDWLQAESELLQFAMSKPVESPKAENTPVTSRAKVVQGREISVSLPKRTTKRVKSVKLA